MRSGSICVGRRLCITGSSGQWTEVDLMVKLLVIADDLTGANETGVQFAKKGISVFVATGNEYPERTWLNEHQVVVVNTESRHLDLHESARRVQSVVQAGIEAGTTHFYKKTDSTLRGNIGSELEALRTATGQRILPFIPAYPKLKRTTVNGIQYVNALPLHETAFAKDPLEPITSSYVPAIIEEQTRAQARVVGRNGTTLQVAVELSREGIYVFDVLTDDDLKQVGELLKRNNLLNATSGSSGFAERLPDLLEFERCPVKVPCSEGRMLVVNGSVNEVSLKQVSHAERNGFVPVTLLPEMLLAEEGAQELQSQQVVDRVIKLDQQGKDVVLRSVEKLEDLKHYIELGQRRGLDSKQIHLLTAKNVGAIAGRILERTNFDVVTVFGGDTLLAIARARRWAGFLPQDEILPGVVVSRVWGDINSLLLITKSGGFGSEDVLPRIKEVLGGNKR
jgi:D-threonate/D-erythronate kinase